MITESVRQVSEVDKNHVQVLYLQSSLVGWGKGWGGGGGGHVFKDILTLWWGGEGGQVFKDILALWWGGGGGEGV